jgi:P-type conjugative transfer protein TrbJ
MVADMAKQATELPMQIFGPIMAEISNLHSVVQNGRALAYSMANLDAEFRNRLRRSREVDHLCSNRVATPRNKAENRVTPLSTDPHPRR